MWSLGCTVYYLFTTKREEKKKKAIDNYLIKYISTSLVLLLSLNRI